MTDAEGYKRFAEFMDMLSPDKESGRNKAKNLEEKASKTHASSSKSDGYMTFLDSSIDIPLKINREVIKDVHSNIWQYDDSRKAEDLYNLIKDMGIRYGSMQQGKRTPEMVLEDRRGNEHEQTLLYITIARSIGLQAAYYSLAGRHSLDRPYAGVKTDDGLLFIDVPRSRFRVKRDSAERVSDRKLIRWYLQGPRPNRGKKLRVSLETWRQIIRANSKKGAGEDYHDNIAPYTKQRYVLAPEDRYHSAYIDDSVNFPFQINREAVREVSSFVNLKGNEYERAKSVYLFMKSRGITYDCLNSRKRNADEVWKAKKGDCFEQSLLYVVLARSVGLKSSYYQVLYDYEAEKVGHACAGVKTGNSTVMADLAYNKFDIEHYRVSRRDDMEVTKLYHTYNDRNMNVLYEQQ